MPLEIQQYSALDQEFKKVGEVKPGESKGFISVKANGDEELVIFECNPKGLETGVYRANPDNTACETIRTLSKGESLGIAAVGRTSLNMKAESASTLYQVIHR